jgi:hypothetical protein
MLAFKQQGGVEVTIHIRQMKEVSSGGLSSRNGDQRTGGSKASLGKLSKIKLFSAASTQIWTIQRTLTELSRLLH